MPDLPASITYLRVVISTSVYFLLIKNVVVVVGVLMRFHQEEVVLIADIEQMFHQVQVPAEDCDALRFLWEWEPQ